MPPPDWCRPAGRLIPVDGDVRRGTVPPYCPALLCTSVVVRSTPRRRLPHRYTHRPLPAYGPAPCWSATPTWATAATPRISLPLTFRSCSVWLANSDQPPTCCTL